MPTKDTITEWFQQLQDEICLALETADGQGIFKEDKWQRDQGGGGRTRVLTDGKIIEKGGVNFSAVHGQLSNKISTALKLPDSDFYATGVSIVLHPKSPMVPIIHMNVRYFETISKSGESTWWFGGGIDLTPHYVVTEDAKYFHNALKSACDKHDASYYPKFKDWADEYFFIKHRNETRGIGGIFFDRLNESTGKTKGQLFDFVKEVGLAFAPIYTHFMSKNADLTFNEQNELWQRVRRGRYVEFNLVWDKGTKFGLDTDGRTESILMSLPPQANWIYDHKPSTGSAEEKTIQLLRKGVDWL